MIYIKLITKYINNKLKVILYGVYNAINDMQVTFVYSCLALYMFIFITLFCFVSKLMFIFVTSILNTYFQ